MKNTTPQSQPTLPDDWHSLGDIYAEMGLTQGHQHDYAPGEYDDDFDELEHDERDCPDCDGYADGGFCEVPCMCYCHTMTADDGQGGDAS